MDDVSSLLIASNTDPARLSAQCDEDGRRTVTLRTDEIRLIRLLPSLANNKIRCETSVVSLHECPEYMALSYTWGAPPDDHVIDFNGRDYQYAKTCGAFWINNAAEKTRQINQMSRIYYQARKVVVWLGPQHSGSDAAMNAIATYATHYRDRRKQAKFWSEPGGVAVTRLCQRAYWTRLWILQELIFAQRVTLLCGQQRVEWSAFLNMMTAMSRRQHSRNDERNTDYQAVARSPAMSLVEQSMRPLDYTLWDLMFANRGLKCSEPRDRVYALLGVVLIKDEAAIVPNYKVPLCRLMNNVLWMHHQEHPPESIEEIAHECGLLTALFGLASADIFDLTDMDGTVQRAVVKDVTACPLGNPRIVGITPWWAAFYGHEAIERILSRRGDIRGAIRGVTRGAVRESSLTQHDEHVNGTLDTAWEWAVSAGEADAVRFLLRTGRIDPSEKQVNGRDALQEAVSKQ
ncbi:hypothetical protein LTR17_015474 [Elasticomyces elasticus]|nr:hypothetical protein LTR17_015474 [Elasticomyces elasticus]